MLQRKMYVLVYKDYENSDYQTMMASFDQEYLQEICLSIAQDDQFIEFCGNLMLRHFTVESAVEYTTDLTDMPYYVEEVLLYGC